jgi:UDP-N-acetylglucosamine 2-epimerase (non-hydrolysing)
MWEVLQQNMDKINNSTILKTLSKQIKEKSNLRESVQSASSVFTKLEPKKYFMVSVHREENVDNEENLKQILTVLNNLTEQYKLPVIVSTHPRTRKRIEALNSSPITHHSSLIHFMKPFGFTDYVYLQMNALCTISDSGTISEESAMLNFPAISLRQSMERPEAQDSGSIILSGFKSDIVLNAIQTVIEEHTLQDTHHSLPFEYKIQNTSWRVVKLILGNTKLSNKWWGIK